MKNKEKNREVIDVMRNEGEDTNINETRRKKDTGIH